MPYHIYRLTSPSGKCYVGLSVNVHARWLSHLKKMWKLEVRHPLYDALRKYGSESFVVEVIATLELRSDAEKMEVREIALHRATERDFGYNISPGGDYDGPTGANIFWESMRTDPAAFKKYRDKLRATQQRRAGEGAIDAGGLILFNASLTARDRWKRAYRALRMTGKFPSFQDRSLPSSRIPNFTGSKSSLRRSAIGCRERAKAQWESRTKEEVDEVSAKIAKSVKALHGDSHYHTRNLAGLAKGRANMDRKVQGAAASKGIKRFWVELRKDPVRYAAYIEARKETLKATNLLKGRKCKP